MVVFCKERKIKGVGVQKCVECNSTFYLKDFIHERLSKWINVAYDHWRKVNFRQAFTSAFNHDHYIWINVFYDAFDDKYTTTNGTSNDDQCPQKSFQESQNFPLFFHFKIGPSMQTGLVTKLFESLLPKALHFATTFGFFVFKSQWIPEPKALHDTTEAARQSRYSPSQLLSPFIIDNSPFHYFTQRDMSLQNSIMYWIKNN